MSKKWYQLVPGKNLGELDGDPRKLIVGVLRSIGPSSTESLDDQQLLDGASGLLNAGLIDIWFRHGRSGIEVKYELIVPVEMLAETSGAVH